MRYRKKPVEVEAWQWVPDDMRAAGEIVGLLMMGELDAPADVEMARIGDDKCLIFYCLKSNAICTIAPGDWVIRESDGVGYYPCTAQMFEATYDAVGGERTRPASVRQGSSLHIGACPRSNPDPDLPADVPCRCGPELPIPAAPAGDGFPHGLGFVP